jgi:hypothetical protein
VKSRPSRQATVQDAGEDDEFQPHLTRDNGQNSQRNEQVASSGCPSGRSVHFNDPMATKVGRALDYDRRPSPQKNQGSDSGFRFPYPPRPGTSQKYFEPFELHDFYDGDCGQVEDPFSLQAQDFYEEDILRDQARSADFLRDFDFRESERERERDREHACDAAQESWEKHYRSASVNDAMPYEEVDLPNGWQGSVWEINPELTLTEGDDSGPNSSANTQIVVSRRRRCTCSPVTQLKPPMPLNRMPHYISHLFSM